MEWKTRAVAGCVGDFKPLVLGQDPTRIEFLWQIMYRHSFWWPGVSGTTASAIKTKGHNALRVVIVPPSRHG